MEIRCAHEADRQQVVDLYRRSQLATGLPNPSFLPPEQLETQLYSRPAINRFVAIEANQIIGHCVIEPPNPRHIPAWLGGLPANQSLPLLEIGGGFVEPSKMRSGIGSLLLAHSIEVVKAFPATPVSATWQQNEHVKRMFKVHAGKEVGSQVIEQGTVSLFVF